MASDRLVRAGIRHSEKVNGWPVELRYFWVLLWGYCDDFGRGKLNPMLIKADTFPLDKEVTEDIVSRWMQALEIAGVIVPYEIDGKEYFYCPGWDTHDGQALKYQRKSIIPAPFGENSQKFGKSRHQGEGEVEGEIEVGSANAPPSTFCNQHPDGTDTPCRRCGDARRAFKAWETAQKNKPTPRPPRRESTCDVHAEYPLPCIRCQEDS